MKHSNLFLNYSIISNGALKIMVFLLSIAFIFSSCQVQKSGCQEENKDVFQVTIAQASSEFPRNSESDMIVLKGGKLLLAWTEFYGITDDDDASARIVARTSEDNGRTWGKKYTLLEHERGLNVMQVNFLRLNNGDIALFYLNKHEEVPAYWNESKPKAGDCRLMMSVSKDEGKTFTFVNEITQKGRYVESANGRSIMLKSGRILIECDEYFGNAFCVFSDDDGKTWHEGKPVRPGKGRCHEPAAIQLKNGDLLMFLRTSLGGQYQTISGDQGETWSEPTLSAFRGSAAPISIERIPGTGDLLAIWNNDTATMANGYSAGGVNQKQSKKRSRNPLTSAISKDEGKTWGNFRNIEDALDDAFAYPALTWIGNRALITYISYNGGISLHLKSMMLDWFYQDDSGMGK